MPGSRMPRWLARLLLPAGGLVVVLAAFEAASRTDVLPHRSFPPVTSIFAELGRISVTGDYWQALGDTLQGWATAMLLASLIAVPLGLLIGATRIGYLLARFTVDFLRPIPSVALIPLLVLLYGTRPSLKITLAVFGATFPLLFQAMYAVRDVDPVAKDSARSCGLTGAQRLRWVILPSCVPFVVTGVRLASSIALILVVTGEYVVGVEGIGKSVFMAQSGAAYPKMYAYVVTAGLLGLALDTVFELVERWMLFWHVSRREVAR
jgi:ABC-type nitrate/sulfonate/bicarbonate transport system permease component